MFSDFTVRHGTESAPQTGTENYGPFALPGAPDALPDGTLRPPGPVPGNNISPCSPGTETIRAFRRDIGSFL